VAALIAAQRDEHGIPAGLACRALGVSRSWFYKHEDGALPPQPVRHEQLKAEVRRLFAAHRGKYGSPRITADLRDEGWAVSKNTVAAVMCELGLAARRKKKRKATIRPGKGRWRAPDLVRRGSEYTARLFRRACTRLSISQSMGRPGSALDNAVIESWHSTVEFELRRVEHFATRAQARPGSRPGSRTTTTTAGTRPAA
jgi:transposase InsO family protein